MAIFQTNVSKIFNAAASIVLVAEASAVIVLVAEDALADLAGVDSGADDNN